LGPGPRINAGRLKTNYNPSRAIFMPSNPITAPMTNMPPRPPGAPDPKIKLHEHSNHGGWDLEFTGVQVSYIGSAYNDKVSSLKVESGQWELYEHADFNTTSPGKSLKVSRGSIPNLDPLGMNDKITSLRPIGW
jgi:Beta/Gamma crystallin